MIMKSFLHHIKRVFLSFLFITILLTSNLVVVADGSEAVESGSPGSISPAGLVEAQKRAILELHNAFRAIVKPPASNMMKMSWDSDLETIASNFASKCIVAHNPDRHKQAKHYDWVGENIAWGTGMCGDKECGDVFEGVKRWFSENKNYHYATGQCSGKCTLYTQMVWWESNKLGCGAKRCGDRTILVCNYAPGGNYVGQRPYTAGKPCGCPNAMHCENNLCIEKDEIASPKQELQPVAVPVPEIAKGKHMLPEGWTELSIHLTQADSGLTEYIWGMNLRHELFYLEQDNMLAKVDGTLHHVTVGQSGVWGVGVMGNVFFRRDVSEVSPAGSGWQKIAGNLKQVDSGPAGIVWGVNRLNSVYCRAGISKETMPFGTGWKHIKGNLKYVSCGDFGCWGVNKRDNIYFRLGVTALRPEGEQWIILPGKLRMIESGPAGQTVGVSDTNDVFYRAGVTSVKPEGSSWVKMDVKLSHVTIGLRGIIGILLDGTVAIKKDFNPPDSMPTGMPSVPTDASPLEVQTFPTINAATTPGLTVAPHHLLLRNPTNRPDVTLHPPTTRPAILVSVQPKADRPSAAAKTNEELTIGKTASGEVHISPALANKILDMMQKKGNQSELSHQQAAASTPQESANAVNGNKPASVLSANIDSNGNGNRTKPVVNQVIQPSQTKAETQEKPLQSAPAPPVPVLPLASPINTTDISIQGTKATSQTAVIDASGHQANSSTGIKIGAIASQPQVAVAKVPMVMPKVAVGIAPAPLPSTPAIRPTLRPAMMTTRHITTQALVTHHGQQHQQQQQQQQPSQNRLSTSTHAEMNHIVNKPTIQPNSQERGGIGALEEMKNIGPFGKKHLQQQQPGNELGGEYLSGVLSPTMKPVSRVMTAPNTKAMTVSWELTRSCCAVPDSVCPIPGDCTGYIECHKYRGVYKGCEREKMFNPITNICDFPRNVDCEPAQVQPVAAAPSDQSPNAPVHGPPVVLHQQKDQTATSTMQQQPMHEEPQQGMIQQRHDAALPKQEDLLKPRVTAPQGENEGVLREVWFGLGLSPQLFSLTSNPRFPNTPDEYIVLDKFEAPPNAGDGYGQRLSTYYKAPAAGDYTFFLACDNECELWVSPDTEEIHSTLVSELKHGHFTSFRQWDKYVDEQTSRSIKLKQGSYFFLEAFMKEGTGGDNLSVGIRLPDGRLELPISSNLYLIPSDGTASYVGSRVSQQAATAINRENNNSNNNIPPSPFYDAEQTQQQQPQQYFGNADQSSTLTDTDMDLPLGRRRTSVKRSSVRS